MLASYIHRILMTRGIRVFYSGFSLEKLGVSDYKKAIDRALDSARVLVVVGTSVDNLNSEWVRYEWDSFFNDILSGRKPEGRVFAYLDGVRPSDLPRALRQSQAIIDGPGSFDHLYAFVSNAIADRQRQEGLAGTSAGRRQKSISARMHLRNVGCSVTIVASLLLAVGLGLFMSRQSTDFNTAFAPSREQEIPSEERVVDPATVASITGHLASPFGGGSVSAATALIATTRYEKGRDEPRVSAERPRE